MRARARARESERESERERGREWTASFAFKRALAAHGLNVRNGKAFCTIKKIFENKRNFMDFVSVLLFTIPVKIEKRLKLNRCS